MGELGIGNGRSPTLISPSKPSMKDRTLQNPGALTRLILRLYPDLVDQDNATFLRTYEYILLSMYLGPFIVVGLVWLAAASDWALIVRRWPALLIILLALLAMSRQTFNLIFALDGESGVTLISSLSNLALWAGILVVGPTILWLPLLVALINRSWVAWQLYQYNQNPVWESLSFLAQDLFVDVFAPLVALLVYGLLGGDYPLTAVTFASWGAAFAAMIISAILPGIVLLPPMLHVGGMLQRQFSRTGSLQFIAQVTAMSLIMSPFAVLVALAYVNGGLGAFIFFIIGIILINMLAATLSRMAERSRQRTRELARLESLSEALLQAPPDAINLPDILSEHLPRMFPDAYDLIEVRLWAAGSSPVGGILATETPADTQSIASQILWQVVHPPTKPPLAEADWSAMRQAAAAYLVQHDVVLPGMRATYGHAVLVKIMEIVPGREAADGVCLGGVYLLRHRRSAHTLDSLTAVQALANQIGAALYRARVHQETLAHQKVAQELEFAGRIQASFLPRSVPVVSGWDLAAALVPARQTSGDFYDFIELGDGRLGLLVADVADKGTGAALYMALSRTLLRTYATEYPDAPEHVLQAANERILADTESDQFVTLFYGVLDPAANTLTYSNAGHNPAFLIDSHGRLEPQPLGQTGIPLGMFPDMAWRHEVVRVAPGSVLVMYTDGVSEAQNEVSAEFGETRLLAAVTGCVNGSAKEMETAVLTALQTFVGQAPQFDDITLMVAVNQAV